MSLGVHMMSYLVQKMAILDAEGFDFQVSEIHHRDKKDRPSGTAKHLQSLLEEKISNLPEPLVARSGGVFGKHEVAATSNEEILSITHLALNRKVFAVGAVKAAQWIQGKPAGRYELADLFSERKA